MMRIKFRTFITDKRTARMVVFAEKLGGPLRITQGSYSSSVGASAGTHSGGGTLDFSVKGLTLTQINKRVRALRRVGFAAWYRPPLQNVWGPHIHAVAVGCRDLSPIAARQVAALRRGRDGLRANQLDRHRAMNLPVVTFEHYLVASGKRVSLKAVLADVRSSRTYTGVVGEALKKEVGGNSIMAYAKWQHLLHFVGSDADGMAGMDSLSKLGKKHGFRVVA